MFTGLIEEVGVVSAVHAGAEGSRIRIAAQAVLQGVALGDSIAVDGACMTVVDFDAQGFCFEASPESLSKTSLGQFKPGRRVNLERPLTPTSRLGGHYVTGHVDGQAQLVRCVPEGNSTVYTFEVGTPELAELLVPKGSVAILGISLTVNTVEANRFTVAIIPHTLAHTNLNDYQVGDWVNIETDLLGKYVRRLLFERLAQNPEPESPSASMMGELAPGVGIDLPTLVPAVNAMRMPPADALAGTQIRSGAWFNQTPD